MRLSTKGRYALRAVLDMVCHCDGNPVSIADISKRQELSFDYVEQLFTKLRNAGFLKSTRGPQGGYLLTKSARDITAGDIIRVVEGPLSPVFCVDPEEERTKKCPRSQDCLTRPLWKKVGEKIEEVLDSVTLEDLIKDKKG